MKYRATYDAKTKKLSISINGDPANQYGFARMKNEKLPWIVTVAYRLNDETIIREVHPRMLSLADLRKELDALDATRYKELSFSASSD